MAIIYKELRQREEIHQLTPKTLLLVADAHFWCFQRGIDLMITCIGRTLEERKALVEKKLAKDVVSVHEVWRGVDFRILFPEELNQQLIDHMNMKYPYDPTRPDIKTMIRHEGTHDHLHLQSLI